MVININLIPVMKSDYHTCAFITEKSPTCYLVTWGFPFYTVFVYFLNHGKLSFTLPKSPFNPWQ